MNTDKWRELAELYAVGALDGTEREEFEALIEAGDEACLRYLRETQESLEKLSGSLNLLEPPARVRDAVLTAVRAEAIAAGPVVRASAVNPFWAATGIWVLASVLVVGAWQATSGARHAEQFKRMESSLMAAPGSRAVALAVMEKDAKGSGKVIWNNSGECVFLTMGLSKSAKDRVYQLWGLKGGEPVSAGIFEVDEHGCAVLALKNFQASQFEKFAVTLEPAGGVPKPTGPMVLAGGVS